MAQKKAKTNSNTRQKQTTKNYPRKTTEAMAVQVGREKKASLYDRITGVILLLLSLCIAAGYFTTEGRLIEYASRTLKGLLGWGYWLTAVSCFCGSLILLFHSSKHVRWRTFCTLMLPVLFGTVTCLFFYEDKYSGLNQLFERGVNLKPFGGFITGTISSVLYKAVGPIVTGILLVLLFIIFLYFSLNSGTVTHATSPTASENDFLKNVHTDVIKSAYKQNADNHPSVNQVPRQKKWDFDLGDDDAEFGNSIKTKKQTQKQNMTNGVSGKRNEQRYIEPVQAINKNDLSVPERKNAVPELRKPEPQKKRLLHETKPVEKTDKVVISDSVVDKEAENIGKSILENTDVGDYNFPPLTLLNEGHSYINSSDDEVKTTSNRLSGALKSFGINAEIVDIIRGPTVTRYDIELEQGVKLARITNLSGDLALALGAINVRIAPIPDKISTVGIEVPNKIVSTVYLRDILGSDNFRKAKSRLSFAIGKDISGDCIVGNISKLPHMLIAGTTGSGKSVCMNTIIMSILYKAKPEEVRFIMIDPKMVELGIYNGVPHQYIPVVTEPKKAAGALQWAVVEMLKRYRLFSDIGVRDLASYNEHCRNNSLTPLPQIVIIIDELADLMLVASKEVEESICRVAQMGRAAGMHLIIATQRPSADVITGLMKANIPSRIAFAVSSSLESRIILDQTGAEKLIGMGDMLYSPVGCGKPIRIQGAYVSDEEREAVIQYIKDNTNPSAIPSGNKEIEDFMNKASEGKNSSDNSKGSGNDDSDISGDFDEMISKAVEVVIEMKSCSVSMLQRRLKLGYSRAARIVDQMEELEVVGPYEGAKPRTVLVDLEGWHEIAHQIGIMSDDEYYSVYPDKADLADCEV